MKSKKLNTKELEKNLKKIKFQINEFLYEKNKIEINILKLKNEYINTINLIQESKQK